MGIQYLNTAYFYIANIVEFRMRLVGRITEMFNFRHREFTNTDQSRARRDFITERVTNLCCSEWQFTLVNIYS